MERTWWKEGTIYQIYPRSFNDSSGDGIGDLRGIIEKLDYLKSLNIDILWLSPIYGSPNDDNGYDISDYRGIMQEFGSMADFDELLEGVHARGMRLVLDTVLNHSSDEHPWFQASKASKDNPYRDYYFWRPGKNGGPPNNWRSMFSGSAWEYDETTGEYYLHYFTRKQPDLNWENPKVRQELYDILRFWLDKGVDGFRMDVIPMISKQLDFADYDYDDFHDVINNVYTNGPRVHEFLQEMYREVLAHYDSVALGEGVGILPSNANLYVGQERGELDLAYHFDLLEIGQGPGGKFDPVPYTLADIKMVFNTWYEALGEEGWVVNCLDNHDFPRMVSRFGNDGEYWKESAKLLLTMLGTQRGTLCIYHGSEIGMTNVAFPSIDDYDDVMIKNYYREAAEGKTEAEKQEILRLIQEHGRDNARTPIQWNNRPNAGFTSGTPWLKVNPNYEQINAAAQEDDPDSILNYYRRFLEFRKSHPTLVYGKYESIDNDNPAVYAYRRWDEHGEYLILLNFTSGEVRFELHGETGKKPWRLLIGNSGRAPGFVVRDNIILAPWEAMVLRG